MTFLEHRTTDRYVVLLHDHGLDSDAYLASVRSPPVKWSLPRPGAPSPPGSLRYRCPKATSGDPRRVVRVAGFWSCNCEEQVLLVQSAASSGVFWE
ncbi:hypothetical protein ACP70R_000416 [Stipagrostis hirtigluma subsp. patula]